jgi:diadenosine tetraphosphate (Ap4A) HIT family hydrolase
VGEVDPRFVVHETAHWLVNHRDDAVLPGYLMIAAKAPAGRPLAELGAAALAELGPLLARTTRLLESEMGAKRVYCGRYGHSPGWPVHFHVMPVYAWVEEAFARDDRCRVLSELHRCGETRPDGADLTVFIWRRLTTAEGAVIAVPEGWSVAAAIAKLQTAFRRDDSQPPTKRS